MININPDTENLHFIAPSLTPPRCSEQKLALGEGLKSYLFRDGARGFAVIWAPRGEPRRPVTLASEKLELRDIMGRPQPARAFTPDGTPVYIVSEGLTDAELEAGLR